MWTLGLKRLTPYWQNLVPILLVVLVLESKDL